MYMTTARDLRAANETAFVHYRPRVVPFTHSELECERYEVFVVVRPA
jgi:hypothetical protein